MALCSCKSGGGNLGRPSCYEVFGAAKKLIFVEYFKPDGSVNSIQVSTLTAGKLDQTFLDARTGDLDPRTRFLAGFRGEYQPGSLFRVHNRLGG